jgi:uncharacterized phage protein (TIGR02218 family)
MKDVTETYIEKEEAITRKPAELYRIWSDNETHYYTDGDIIVTYSGIDYIPAPISREMVEYNSELETTTLIINASRLSTPIIEYIAINPFDVFWIEVFKLFRDQDPLEASVIFVGQIKTVKFKGLNAKIECAGFEIFLNKPIPRYRYSPSCNHTLYDSKCTIDKDSYKVSAVLSDLSSDGLTLTSSTFATKDDDYFKFGYAKFGAGRRMIVYHIGDTIKLNYRIPDLENGNTVIAYAGCDLSATTCRDKFSNINNFLGFEHIPIDNPATKVVI